MTIIVTKIIAYSYDDYTEMVTIEFSTKSDGEDFFRSQMLDKETFLYYYPEVVRMRRFEEQVDEDTLADMLNHYYRENPDDLPPQQPL